MLIPPILIGVGKQTRIRRGFRQALDIRRNTHRLKQSQMRI